MGHKHQWQHLKSKRTHSNKSKKLKRWICTKCDLMVYYCPTELKRKNKPKRLIDESA